MAAVSPAISPARVVVGTYNGFLYGLRVGSAAGGYASAHEPEDVAEDTPMSGANNDASAARQQSSTLFSSEAHEGCIKCVASAGRWLASGGTDELIRLYDMHRMLDYGSLYEHTGSVTALEFYAESHLLSASDDGLICVWRTTDWLCMTRLKGHKGSVHSISIHPSGKVLVSVGKDSTLRLWNLVKGQLALTVKLNKPASLIRWSPQGKRYAFVTDQEGKAYVSQNCVSLYQSEGSSTTLLNSATLPSRIQCLSFLEESTLALGCEDGKVYIFDMQPPSSTGESPPVCRTIFEGATKRIRGMQVVRASSSSTSTQLVCATSDGSVIVWDVSSASALEPSTDGSSSNDQFAGAVQVSSPLAMVQSDKRITCMCVLDATAKTAPTGFTAASRKSLQHESKVDTADSPRHNPPTQQQPKRKQQPQQPPHPDSGTSKRSPANTSSSAAPAKKRKHSEEPRPSKPQKQQHTPQKHQQRSAPSQKSQQEAERSAVSASRGVSAVKHKSKHQQH